MTAPSIQYRRLIKHKTRRNLQRKKRDVGIFKLQDVYFSTEQNFIFMN